MKEKRKGQVWLHIYYRVCMPIVGLLGVFVVLWGLFCFVLGIAGQVTSFWLTGLIFLLRGVYITVLCFYVYAQYLKHFTKGLYPRKLYVATMLAIWSTGWLLVAVFNHIYFSNRDHLFEPKHGEESVKEPSALANGLAHGDLK